MATKESIAQQTLWSEESAEESERDRRRAIFLSCLEQTGRVRFSQAQAGISDSQLYWWRKRDREFKRAADAALARSGKARIKPKRLDGLRECCCCKQVKPLASFAFQQKAGRHYSYCRKCKTEKERSRRLSRLAAQPDYKHVHSKNLHNYTLKYQYGITRKQYDAMLLAQGGVCAICKRPESSKHRWGGGARRLAVDHDHQNGKIRGLLCNGCNVILSRASDSVEYLQAAIVYLQASSTTG